MGCGVEIAGHWYNLAEWKSERDSVSNAFGPISEETRFGPKCTDGG